MITDLNIRPDSKALTTCLACGSSHLEPVLDLGAQPLANTYREKRTDPMPVYSLATQVCTECWHMQLTEAVNPKFLFDDYAYVTGTTQTLRNYQKWFAETISNTWKDIFGNRVRSPISLLDIACNDGTLMDAFNSLFMGNTSCGIDPAVNLTKFSRQYGKVICDYLKPEHIPTLKGNFHIITAQNVFAHNSYPLSFLEICKEIMSDETLLFIQNSQSQMIENNEFDTVYHEHLSFWNISSMQMIINRAGLYLVDVMFGDIHGGSNIYVISKIPLPYNPDITKLHGLFNYNQLNKLVTYKAYANTCKAWMREFTSIIKQQKLSKFIVGYGAPAKGMTLLNATRVPMDYIVDENRLKQNKFCAYKPSHDIMIREPEFLLSQLKTTAFKEDILFVPLAWNFYDEIYDKLSTVYNMTGSSILNFSQKHNRILVEKIV